ncbi:hypothetical protein F5884DRAFT_849076 [Xylogone sp. PMI_703]|nr:hypothetical protein F5884DRAFT_849076 [Xylogone sp. PMI_703]
MNGAVFGTRLETLLTNCLDILSNQLYEKSTHLLLELIQNADDNTYQSSCPTLNFTYKPGSLRIDCNETGFTAANVEAICAISQSTNANKTSYGKCIGEKGIGFKSVFKIADVEEFPEETQTGWTSIYLQLSRDYDEETLIQALLTFDTNFLVFLKKIKEINIEVNRHNEQVWKKGIRKSEDLRGEDQVIILHEGEVSLPYLIKTHVIKDLPKEKKRLNWSQTKILLAFPAVEKHKQPKLVTQNVYAFLPIRNYGMKFLLQGDFLLTASREDIESTLPWNITIRDALADAFLLSVDHFKKGQLKYVWPCYLPSLTQPSFLEPAISSILTQLKEHDVLESYAGTMTKPSLLKYVPLDLFADGEGIPFTLSLNTRAGYLSPKYPVWVIDRIMSIGVSQLTPQDFLGYLDAEITQDPTPFYSRPHLWHSRLAELLLKLGTDAELMSLIQDIPLIPLKNGSWTSAGGQRIFSCGDASSLDIPSGIEVLIVDSIAESDPNRRKLFASLGVKPWDASEICHLILKLHESLTFDASALTIDQLISHATFFYKALWQPPKTADLWFVTRQNERCRGREMYIPGNIEPDSPVARIFSQPQRKFAIIHDDYLKAFPFDDHWPIWLVDNLGLLRIPRLISHYVIPKSHMYDQDIAKSLMQRVKEFRVTTDQLLSGGTIGDVHIANTDFSLQDKLIEGGRVEPTSDTNVEEIPIKIPRLEAVDNTKLFALSEEFSFLMCECNTSDVLQALQDNWSHYSRWVARNSIIYEDDDFRESSAELRRSLGACMVRTTKGLLMLRETVLPMTDSKLDKGGLILIVAITDPKDSNWQFLEYFGVAVSANIHYSSTLSHCCLRETLSRYQSSYLHL